MSEKGSPLYFTVELDLGEERTVNNPYRLFNSKDYFFVVSLEGEAEMSINDEDFFPLRQGMRIVLPKKERKEFKVTNSAQEGKTLIFLLGSQKSFEVAT